MSDIILAALREGKADLGVIMDIPRADMLEGLERRQCGRVDFLPVAAPDHPLARAADPIRKEDLLDHTQILLSSGLDQSGSRDWLAHAVNRWRVNNLGLRHQLLLAGAGWSTMPRHLVAEDLAAGRLVALPMDKASVPDPPELSMSVAYHRNKPPGPAGRWLIERLIADSTASKSG
jgi:DNA-binding transcriptional LysR family regulator